VAGSADFWLLVFNASRSSQSACVQDILLAGSQTSWRTSERISLTAAYSDRRRALLLILVFSGIPETLLLSLLPRQRHVVP
jgi:hypothetical protein